ncbi:MAG: DeoR family transcriptional regulator [Clostridia bacterium]|nr:DeoR family transcriptional regulator [Clostridia bacterium]
MGFVERRQKILEILSIRRFEKIDNLAAEFGVSERTIRKDIEELSCYAPIFTIRGKYGGVKVADGYYSSRTYLTDEQKTALINVIKGDTPNIPLLESILTKFSMPTV